MLAQCNNCDAPVCVKCILSGPHKDHKTEKLIETFERRKQDAISKTAEIKEKFIPKCKKENSDIQSQNTFWWIREKI